MVTPSKRQSVGKQGGSGARSRSSSDERKNSAKSPPGSPSLHYQVSYTGEVLTVTILECKVSVSNEWETCEQLYDAKRLKGIFALALVIVCTVYVLCFDDEISGQIMFLFPLEPEEV